MKNSQQGFILAATIWILAAITLGASFFALWSSRAVELARQGQEELQGELDQASTRAVILYLLATRHMTVAGLTVPVTDSEAEKRLEQKFQSSLDVDFSAVGSELPLDDSIFQGVGAARFSLQDEGGLIGLNTSSNNQLSNLLGLLDVPVGQRRPLLDKLLDYIDRDDLHRLHGAEADRYKECELAPPANRFLLTSWELRAILDWDGFAALWREQGLPRLTTVARAGAPNFNTAPALVLQSFVGITDELARKIIEKRQQKPFSNVSDIYNAAGRILPLDPLEMFFLPTSHVRLTIWWQEGHRMQEVHVQLTPNAANHAPWIIDYEVTIPRSGSQKGSVKRQHEISLFATPLPAQ